MARKPWAFLYTVLAVFLAILLLMQLLFLWITRSGAPLNPEFYRVNLLVIDLCLVIIAELLLIWVFFRYTYVSISLGTIVLVAIIVLGRDPLARKRFWDFLTPLARNEYATLSVSDAVFLFVLNALILSFILTVILKETPGEQARVKPKEPSQPVVPPKPVSNPAPEQSQEAEESATRDDT